MAKCNRCKKEGISSYNCSQCQPYAMRHYIERINYIEHQKGLVAWRCQQGYFTKQDEQEKHKVLDKKFIKWRHKWSRARGEKYYLYKKGKNRDWLTGRRYLNPGSITKKLQSRYYRVQVMDREGNVSPLLTKSRWLVHLKDYKQTQFGEPPA